MRSDIFASPANKLNLATLFSSAKFLAISRVPATTASLYTYATLSLSLSVTAGFLPVPIRTYSTLLQIAADPPRTNQT